MNEAEPMRALGESGLLHPNPAAVRAPLFAAGTGFFLAADKVQVKYEMLRAHLVDAQPVTEAAAAHGYSRAAFYLVSASFDQLGMAGLLDERRGRRGPVKLTPGDRGVHPRRRRPARARRWPIRWRTGSGCGCIGGPSSGPAAGEPPGRSGRRARRAQVDYETLRAHLLAHGRLPDGLVRARFTRRGLAGLIAWPAAEPVFVAELIGAARPAWTPHLTRG